MGKKRRPRKGGGLEAGAGKVGAQYTATQLLERVDELVAAFEFDLALQFAARALELEPANTRALETMAVLLLEAGDPDQAYQCLQRAVQLSPEEGHSKYMYLGQMLGGPEAAQCFAKGIKLLENEIAQGGESLEERKAALATAFCSVAELYMTDLCDEADAEQQCGAALERAVATDPNSHEAWQTMCSYCISAQRNDDAKAALQKSLALWLPPEDEDDAARELPAFEFRVNTVRLLIELEMYAEALRVLERLRKEDDEVVDVWYLGGWLAHLRNDTDHAIECLDKARQLFGKVGCDDEQMLRHIEELLGEYQAKGLYTPGDAEGEDNDWVDDDGDAGDEAGGMDMD